MGMANRALTHGVPDIGTGIYGYAQPDGTSGRDTLSIRGRAVAEGYVPIGICVCSGTIQPAAACI
jgi:hypothetical protein